jgi:parvulin-like peptidyl-prolyl isomerase
MKKITVLFWVLCFQNLFAQNLEKQIEKINTIEQATEFVEKNPEFEASIFSITPELDTVNIPAYYKKLELGSVISEDGYIFKAISVEKIEAFRVSYIYLDGKKLTFSQIEKLRSKIISQFKEGIAFSDLAKEYTMDGNLSGDLNWFTEGMMVPEFEEAIKMYKKDEIFTVDIPNRNWYYVTLKTYEDKFISKITLLSIKNGS